MLLFDMSTQTTIDRSDPQSDTTRHATSSGSPTFPGSMQNTSRKSPKRTLHEIGGASKDHAGNVMSVGQTLVPARGERPPKRSTASTGFAIGLRVQPPEGGQGLFFHGYDSSTTN